MSDKDKIKELLNPHLGHLPFLLKIKKDEISIDDISILVDYIKNKKNIISQLPKDLHSYKSYYTLLKDIHFTEINYDLVKFLKENLTSISKKIFLELIESEDVKQKLKIIMDNTEMRKSFLKFSSRIKYPNFALKYLDAVINETQIINSLDDSETKLIQLHDYDEQAHLLPSSWCILKRDTFYSHLRCQRIFLFKFENKIYGVNVDKHYDDIINFQDSKNNTLSIYNNTQLTQEAKKELIKLNLFGKSKQSSISNVDDDKYLWQKILKSALTRLKRFYNFIFPNRFFGND